MSDLDDHVDITYAALGLLPYVLVEIHDAKDDGDEIALGIGIEFGGGVNRETGIELLEMALQELKEQQD